MFPVVVSSDPLQKDEINKKAFEKFRKEHTFVAPTVDNAVPSERFDGECCRMILREFRQVSRTSVLRANSSSKIHFWRSCDMKQMTSLCATGQPPCRTSGWINTAVESNLRPHAVAVFSNDLLRLPLQVLVMVTLPPGPQRNRSFWNKPWRPTRSAHPSGGRRSLPPFPDETRKTAWRDTR